MTKQLYHGMTNKQFQEYYQDNQLIPKNWTTGPIQAFFYVFNYHLSDRSNMLIWVIPQWDTLHFRKGAEKIDKPLAGIVDYPSPDWYSCILNPFNTHQERSEGVKLYSQSDLERYIGLYVKNKKSKRELLELVRSMSDEFGLDNTAERIREFQRKGWKVTDIRERWFEIQTPRGDTYWREYLDPEDLDITIPLEELVEKMPHIDLRASYFARLYLKYWKSTPSRETL